VQCPDGCALAPPQPDTIPGDIIFVVQQKEHAVFKRKGVCGPNGTPRMESDSFSPAGSDLFYEKTLTLSEALCGFKFAIPHLDGRQLLISSNEGDIVKPGSFKAVYDEGMPVWQRGSEKGRLFIHFNVVFPEPGDLGDKEVAQLAALLPPRPSLEVDLDACHEVSVSDIDMEQEMKRQRERQLEEDEEDDPRGGRVQCAQQ
jgi:DnaJ family protein A protein 2